MQAKTLSLLFLGACINPAATDDGGGGGGGGGAWSPIPLADEPDVYRNGIDLVSGIHFTSPDKGYVVTQGGARGAKSGAVFAIEGRAASVVFSGKNGDLEFTGLEPTSSGLVAMTSAMRVVRSDSSGQFAIAKNGNLVGTEVILAFHESDSGTTVVRNSGAVSTAKEPAGPSAMYTDVWAPQARPPIPSDLNLKPEQCQGKPGGGRNPETRYTAYIGHGLIAYTAAPDNEPQLCISKDGGASFKRTSLVVPEDSVTPPTGVLFTSAQNGLTWFGSQYSPAYIQRTTDGGETWNPVALPASVADHELALNAGFFAPDAQHGWIVGYDYDDGAALGLATTDGGATWSVLPGLGNSQLYSGFALDATHVWVGGEDGVLFASR